MAPREKSIAELEKDLANCLEELKNLTNGEDLEDARSRLLKQLNLCREHTETLKKKQQLKRKIEQCNEDLKKCLKDEEEEAEEDYCEELQKEIEDLQQRLDEVIKGIPKFQAAINKVDGDYNDLYKRALEYINTLIAAAREGSENTAATGKLLGEELESINQKIKDNAAEKSRHDEMYRRMSRIRSSQSLTEVFQAANLYNQYTAIANERQKLADDHNLWVTERNDLTDKLSVAEEAYHRDCVKEIDRMD